MNTYKLKAVLAGTAITAVALAGCGAAETKSSTSATSPPTTSTTIAKKQTTTTLASQDVLIEAYVSVMKDYFPGTSRSTLIELGQNACMVIKTQGSVLDAMLAIANDPSFRGMEEAVGYTFGVAVPVFCPQYQDEVDAIIAS
jgi:hypothetical protein